MKRNTFIRLSIIASSALILPLSYCKGKESDLFHILSTPLSLSYILDKKSITDLGIIYLKRISSSNPKSFLVEQLLKNLNIQTYEDLLIKEALLRKIKQDFQTSRIVLLDGWFISITEAQQCALLSLK